MILTCNFSWLFYSRLLLSLLIGLLISLLISQETLATTTPAMGEEPAAPQSQQSATAIIAGVALSVPETAEKIVVDGVLSEAAWEAALSMPLTYETRPAENTLAPVETRIYLTYDSDNLYIAFLAEDPEPEKIRARLSDRDQAFQDDFVGVALDTFNDERRAFEFFVNPLGVQMDLIFDDVNGREDGSWNGIWDSAGKLTTTGYVVEMAIPYSTLRFPKGSQNQRWGLDALRFYPRGDRHRLSINPQDRAVDCYLCQLTKIEGFGGASPGRNLEITPTATAARQDRRESFPDGKFQQGDTESDIGLTATWGITPNITFSGTLNPDFSQVEADTAQLSINRQFALFFPERRSFFLEGQELFSTPFNAVFTRNVADPTWGAKLAGKVGKNAIGLFAAKDELTNLLFPGSQGSRTTSLPIKTTDSVLRYRRDIGDSSALGGLITSRSGTDYSNEVYGIDGLYRFNDSNSVSFQGLLSNTQYPAAVAAEFGQPQGSLDDHAIRADFNHRSRNWQGWGRYRDIGPDFRADLGFISQVGFSRWVAGLAHLWWGEEEDWYTSIRVGGEHKVTTDSSGQELERRSELNFRVSGPLQSTISFGGGVRDQFFNGTNFSQTFFFSWLEVRPSGNLWLGMFSLGGDTIDFANTRPAERLRLEPNVTYNFGRHLRANLSHTYEKLDVEGGNLFTANLSNLRLTYQFNLRTFARLVLQNTDISRTVELFNDPQSVSQETNRLFTQLLGSYKINPRTVVFLGYSDNYRGDERVDLTQVNRAVFLKVGYAWVL